MRRCPFCGVESADELTVCAGCTRRLPPLPPRRAGSAPSTTGVSLPPRPPPSPTPDAPRTTAPYGERAVEGRQALLDVLNPGPAAHRREVTPEVTSPDPARARRVSDVVTPAIARVATPTRPPPLPPAATRPPTPPPPPTPLEPLGAGPDATPAPVAVAVARPRSELAAERPFEAPQVLAVPEVPEPGLVSAAKYAVHFGRARWQRRGAIKLLGAEIKQDTESLDQVLGVLGREARDANVQGRVFAAENASITAAEDRVTQLVSEQADVEARKADESSKFVDIERERHVKLTEAERLVDEAQSELSQLEVQRRSLRDKRKEHERRQRTYLRNAEDADKNAANAQSSDTRAELRRSAEDFRKEAAHLEPERQELDRKLAAIERPIGEATAKLDAAKAELDAAKRSLADAREGHTHRLAELDAEHKRKAREIALAEGEIQRRLVTLGTLVNLNRVSDTPAFADLYARIDRIRSAITSRASEIEKLAAERDAYDRGTLVRGITTIGGALVLFIALLAILRAAL